MIDINTTTIVTQRPDFTKQVERGADLLDERFGTDWRDGIDLSKLDLQNSDVCVLGQVFVTGIVNGAVQTVSGHENYYGGIQFLFPRDAFVHLGAGASDQVDAAAAHHGFLINEKDVEAYNEATGQSLSIESLYEVLTAQWAEYLSPAVEDDEDDNGF